VKSLVALPDALLTNVGCSDKMVNEFTVPEELHHNGGAVKKESKKVD